MKKLFITAIAITALVACKKKDDATVTPSSPTTQQDANLIGSWAQDSSKSDGAKTSQTDTAVHSGGFIVINTILDSLYISKDALVQINTQKSRPNGITTYTNIYTSQCNWQTAGDSLFESVSVAGKTANSNHYKYTLSGKTLDLYLKCTACDGYNIHYWYHKI